MSVFALVEAVSVMVKTEKNPSLYFSLLGIFPYCQEIVCTVNKQGSTRWTFHIRKLPWLEDVSENVFVDAKTCGKWQLKKLEQLVPLGLLIQSVDFTLLSPYVCWS